MEQQKPKTLITAFIRVSEQNNTENGLVSYTLEDIKNIVNDLCDRYTNTKYCIIYHNKDFNLDGPCLPHFHIVLSFKTPIRFKYIKASFPYGNIESSRSIKACVQYLIHKNDSDKYQYDRSDILTNYDVDDFNSFFINDRKIQKLTDSAILDDIIERIDNGEIQRYNYTEFIDNRIYSKYKSRIKASFDYYDDKRSTTKRNINVTYVEGPSGVGKSSFLERLCTSKGLSHASGSANNDVFNDYKNEDALICNDMRDSAFSFADFLKFTDNYYNSSNCSRFYNKFFYGSNLFISAPNSLMEWYPEVTNLDLRKQLYRRITTYIKINSNTITEYKLTLEGKLEPLCSYPNIFLRYAKPILEKEQKEHKTTKTRLDIFNDLLAQLKVDNITINKILEDDIYYNIMSEEDIQDSLPLDDSLIPLSAFSGIDVHNPLYDKIKKQ